MADKAKQHDRKNSILIVGVGRPPFGNLLNATAEIRTNRLWNEIKLYHFTEELALADPTDA